MNIKKRCFGNKPGQEFYAEYHDTEWGIPSHDDKHLFEMLILEGAQAGLSWETILKRRQGYRKAFHNFDVQKVAAMSDDQLNALRNDDAIIRNRLKIFSARQNAGVFITIQKEFGSFDKYLWKFVHNKPIMRDASMGDRFIASSPISDAIAKDLKKRGMNFVGTTIIYAFMQAIGMVNDHMSSCWKFRK